ncbi:putative transferase [Helianthus annuus]|uniref:Transferase n=2 Tax=Helianthus annuus TaxID=4232 RepID=A0A251TSQ8_HELAN|nr:pelargonidin 3-O-(6-caffeoylglucoside) 5-O-(6-O-malonylglucoside) 4'''-malonyltransferase [Helianthus annuus]KAF5789947.1 putative transferase [Helianthus annuus]KAF5789948.1 putative transferase [Helianthus annuus]KAJ0525231.1 putative transferase [Helianthus annuus]KAJ0533284.1 putative transferase [Helianthus annuus]KAJ0541601.1 putative transferase [Helianthus annuus]
MEIKTNLSKLVKPSTPTPSNLSNYNISFFDEQMPNINTPLILYYTSSQNAQNDVHINTINHLETSLTKALTDFYPLAGRYMRHGAFVDCSDQGALYVQATTNFRLSDFLGLTWELKYSMLQDFLPCDIGESGETDDPLLSIKVTTFECGGVAIGMCFSHKVSDMATMSTFINNWAARNHETCNSLELRKYSPIFNFAHDFPKRDELDLSPRIPRSSFGVKATVRMFSFKANAISKLREKLTFKDDRTHRPSKIQLIVALLWKALVHVDKANTGQSKASFIQQGVNLRDKVVPKLPNNFCGNFVSVAISRIGPDQVDNIDLQDFLIILNDSIKKIEGNYANALMLTKKEYNVLVEPFLEFSRNIANNDVNFYAFTSWCKFSFNNADFGWGNPVWRSTGHYAGQNFVLMMDDQEGDGVEAWVHLDENRLCQLEQDPDIQAYAI